MGLVYKRTKSNLFYGVFYFGFALFVEKDCFNQIYCIYRALT